MIFGSDEPGIDLMERSARWPCVRMRNEPRFRVATIDGPTTPSPDARSVKELLAMLDEHLVASVELTPTSRAAWREALLSAHQRLALSIAHLRDDPAGFVVVSQPYQLPLAPLPPDRPPPKLLPELDDRRTTNSSCQRQRTSIRRPVSANILLPGRTTPAERDAPREDRQCHDGPDDDC